MHGLVKQKNSCYNELEINKNMNFANTFNHSTFEKIEIKSKSTLEEKCEAYSKLSKNELNQSLDRCAAKDAPQEGLNTSQKEQLKCETNWSYKIINQIKTVDEANIYKNAQLEPQSIDSKECLTKTNIDLNQTDEFGLTNIDRMERGRAPIDNNGQTIELHHIGQKSNNGLAELNAKEHRGNGNDMVLHDKTQESQIDRTEFRNEREAHWMKRAEIFNTNNN